MVLSLIAAIGKNNEIGKGNELLWDLPIDMKHFQETTKGHPIIMGKKTFESIGRPLPNRRNLVLTRDKNFNIDGIEVFHSIEELEQNLNETVEKDDNVFVIGGGQIYKSFIDKADRLYITKIDAEFPEADTFFPPIDENKWEQVSEEKRLKDPENIYDCIFMIYTKKTAS